MTIAGKVQEIVEGIQQAARRVGRDPSTVQLVAATKTMASSQLLEAYAAGVRIFGENRLQEAQEKIRPLVRAMGSPGILSGTCNAESSRISWGILPCFIP